MITPRSANAHRALSNALLKLATPAEMRNSRDRPWASVTFPAPVCTKSI